MTATNAANAVLHADAHLRREDADAQGQRQVVHVAVGVLIAPDGRFLLTSRPAGKVYAGYWEFPGGKIEPGESVARALARELHEELGLTLEEADIAPWREQRVDYPHALVHLHFCQVRRWQGELHMREGQSFSWQRLPVALTPILPGAVPVLQWLAQDAQPTGDAAPQGATIPG